MSRRKVQSIAARVARMTKGLAVIVLAGGRATRMGGGDKPLKSVAGRPILSHMLERVAAPDRPVALNANGDAARFDTFGLPIVPDATSDYPGPLAGILAGLDWAAGATGAEYVLSVPGDCPFIPRDLAERLDVARRSADVPLACAASGGWTHPVIGLWPVVLRDELRAALARGERKIDRFTAIHGCVSAEWPISEYDPFFNVNTPEELADAERIAALVSAGRAT